MTYHSKGKFRSGLLILLPFILSYSGMSAQITDYTGLEKQACSEFVSGRYGEALDHYIELKVIFQQNPGYHYYIGRCHLELDNNMTEAIDNLRFAAIKGEQYDAWFFLGEAYHLNGEYEKAVYAYKRFMQLGRKSDIKRLNVKELVSMAENKNNFVPGKTSAITRNDNHVNVKEEQPEMNEKNRVMPGLESQVRYETNAAKEDVNVVQNDAFLTEALNLQLIADSLNRTAKVKRADLKETELTEERNKLIVEISHLEKDSRKIQREADKLFESMRKDTFPKSFDDTVKSHEIIELKEEINGIKVYQFKTDKIYDKELFTGEIADTSADEDKSDDNKKPAGDDLFFLNKYNYNGINPIPVRNHYPDKLVYHIQLGVFSKKVEHDSFGAIAPICYDEIENKGLFKYYAGLFFSYKAASEAHIKIKSMGYQDSFIVAFNEGEQISLDEALQIEYARIKF